MVSRDTGDSFRYNPSMSNLLQNTTYYEDADGASLPCILSSRVLSRVLSSEERERLYLAGLGAAFPFSTLECDDIDTPVVIEAS